MTRPPSVVVPSGTPGRTRSDEERVSAARHRELAEEFARTVGERRSGAVRAERTARAETSATGRLAADEAFADAPARTSGTRTDGVGTTEPERPVGEASGRRASGPDDARRPPDDAPPPAPRSRDAAATRPGETPEADRPAVPAPPEAGEDDGSVGTDTATPPAGGEERGDDVPTALRRAEETARSRGDGADEGSVNDGTAPGAALAAPPDAVAAPAPGEGGNGVAESGAGPAGGDVARERITEMAEAMSALLADADRFAETPEDGRWRFTLLDGDEDTIGFVVTRDASGARSVAVEDEDGRHDALLEELRARLAALDVDVTVGGPLP